MTKKQQKLVINNMAILQHLVEGRLAAGTVPHYVKDDFISDAALRFCISAMKYDEELGFKFSTYAYGGFKICWNKFKTITEGRYKKENFCPTKTIEFIIDKFLEDAPRVKHFDRETLCCVIDDANLTWREMMILQDYYFEELSMHEVGKRFEVTRERIRQIRGKILRKLKRSMDASKLTFEDFYTKD